MLGLGLDFLPRRRRAGFVRAGLPLAAYGPGVTVGAPDGEGWRLMEAGAETASRAVGSPAAVAGDLLLEIMPLGDPPATMFGFDDAAPEAGRAYAQVLETVQVEGHTGAPNWLGAWKAGAFQGVLPPRRGALFQERVGTAWRIYTGADWPAARAAGPVFTGTAADAGPRHLAVTDIAAGARVKLRWGPHPGG